ARRSDSARSRARDEFGAVGATKSAGGIGAVFEGDGMRVIEAKLRDALREMGEQVSAGRALPLRLPAGPPQGNQADTAAHPEMALRIGNARTSRQLRRWLTPVAAAAAVLAIAVGLSTVAAIGHRLSGDPRSDQLPGHVPPYYVAIHLVSGSQN